MKKLQDISLARQLTVVMVGGTLVVVVMAVALLGAFRVVTFRPEAEERVERMGAMVAPGLATALVFDDEVAAQLGIDSLGQSPLVQAATLYRDDGTVLVAFRNPDSDVALPSFPPIGESAVEGARLTVRHQIEAGDTPQGLLLIAANWGPREMFAGTYSEPVAALLLASILAAWALSLLSYRAIMRPILEISDRIRLITHRRDYSLRINKTTNDAVGILIENFNGMMEQVTEHDEELSTQSRRLEETIQERTAEQARTNGQLKKAVAELKEAKNAAEEANRTKSQFLARMSHEIRTPMNGVLGMTDLLLHSDLSTNQKNLANTVYRSGEALLHIINDILDFSKIEAGKLDLDEIEFDMRELVEASCELLADPAQKKGLELVVVVDDAVPNQMTGDPTRLRQILINLVGNAIKFTACGEVLVRVGTLHEANNNVVLRFEVKDNGVGITPETLKHIFNPFSQADASTTRKYGGTGLGLAICRQLTLMMGGDIGAESIHGEGSTFWFTACFRDPVREAAGHMASRESLSGHRVLLATPSASLRGLVQRRLVACGVTVEAPESCERLLQQILSAARLGTPFSAAVIDQSLRDPDPSALAQRVASDDAASQCRMILLSTLSCDKDEVASSGFVDRIRKPVKESELYDVVARACGVDVPESQEPDDQDRLDRQGTGAQFDAHILVAEDNAVNQEVVRGMLLSIGCRVTIAVNGSEAVAQVKDGHFDLVLMDCQMPVMDGFDATRAIKLLMQADEPYFRSQDVSAAALPIVALTANAMEGDREKCISRGMDDYMSKPFTLRDLEEILMRWIPTCLVGGSVAALADPAGPEPVPATDHPDPPETSDFSDILGSEPIFVPKRSSTPEPPAEAEAPEPETHGGSAALPMSDPRLTTLLSAPDSPSNDGPLDMRVLASIREVERNGVPNLLERVVDSYIEETPKLIRGLRAAYDVGDPDAIRKAAHAVKSSSANVGARALSVACKEVEMMDDKELLDRGADFMDYVDRGFAKVRTALTGLQGVVHE